MQPLHLRGDWAATCSNETLRLCRFLVPTTKDPILVPVKIDAYNITSTSYPQNEFDKFEYRKYMQGNALLTKESHTWIIFFHSLLLSRNIFSFKSPASISFPVISFYVFFFLYFLNLSHTDKLYSSNRCIYRFSLHMTKPC